MSLLFFTQKLLRRTCLNVAPASHSIFVTFNEKQGKGERRAREALAELGLEGGGSATATGTSETGFVVESREEGKKGKETQFVLRTKRETRRERAKLYRLFSLLMTHVSERGGSTKK